MISNLSYSPETPNLGQIRRFLEPCDLEIWRMTLKNNRVPLLCCFQLCAWFDCHMWIQTGVRVQKRLSWVLTSVSLTFDLWPWPFAWTSLLTMVITPENFMMIRWWEHGEKGVTDRQTDRQMDGRTDGLNQSYSCLVAAKEKKNDVDSYRKSCTIKFNIVTAGDLASTGAQGLNGHSVVLHKTDIEDLCQGQGQVFTSHIYCLM